MKNSKHYKYIHIIWGNELKFFSRLVEIINRPENRLQPEEHLFVTPYTEVYEALKDKGTFEFINIKNKRSGNIVNLYGSRGDWIFIHNICSPSEGLKIKRKYLNKIIWRTWGSDVGYSLSTGNTIKRMLKRTINYFWKKAVRSFYAVGVANIVDKLDITKRYGQLNFVSVPYAAEGGYDSLLEAKENMAEHKGINVLIGHSGYSNDNHIAIMKNLEKYKQEDITLYLTLSYGIKEYIDEIKSYVSSVWGKKAIIIEEFMPYSDFAKHLSNMDVAIFDGKLAYALGNIGMLVFLDKKLFLNSEGVIKEAFDKEGLPYETTSNIEDMSFEKFSSSVVYSDIQKQKLCSKPYIHSVEIWRNLLETLDKKSNEVNI